jgi:hypothetical protein
MLSPGGGDNALFCVCLVILIAAPFAFTVAAQNQYTVPIITTLNHTLRKKRAKQQLRRRVFSIMAFVNKIKKVVLVDNVMKNGASIAISVATKTTAWMRTENAAVRAGHALKDTLEKSPEHIPEDTTELIVR